MLTPDDDELDETFVVVVAERELELLLLDDDDDELLLDPELLCMHNDIGCIMVAIKTVNAMCLRTIKKFI